MAKKKHNSQSGPESGRKVSTVNKKARFNFHILETFEAGVVLTGQEIKSIRNNGISLNEAYVRVIDDEVWLLGAHVKEYEFSNERDYNPTRSRKLLLHRREINKLRGRVEQKGLTIVPVQLYLLKGRAKIEIALGQGKANPDKRRTIIDRERKRDAERAMKR